jgi:hypothetical protein
MLTEIINRNESMQGVPKQLVSHFAVTGNSFSDDFRRIHLDCQSGIYLSLWRDQLDSMRVCFESEVPFPASHGSSSQSPSVSRKNHSFPDHQEVL